ncbi:MAG: EMC3/TMCO1 family protein [Candidatus Pacearchaeota archaeon]
MVLKEFMVSNPKISIVIISFLITFVMVLVTKYFTDQTRMKELKIIQKKHQKKLKEKIGDRKAQSEIQKEIMSLSMEMMKHSFRPLIITFLPLILVFLWIRGIYIETAIATSWIWWYIGASLASSIILRKVLDVA